MENVCILCATSSNSKEGLVRIQNGCFHRSCLKRILKDNNDNLTDEEVDFLIDTEIKEYHNLKIKEKINILKMANK